MARGPYKRVLVKLSGEAMSGPGGFGIEPAAVELAVEEVASVVGGAEVALVIGAGNFVRGKQLADETHIHRATADYMGMLATVINALALQDALEHRGLSTRVLGAITMTAICEPFIRRRAIRHLEKGRVIILAAGTGSPFFTTDTCAALRAQEIGADVLIKATKVDGVFEADPVEQPDAKRYDTLTYQDALQRRLGVMDLTAISMCMENRLPVIVSKLSTPGNLAAAVAGKDVGTLITDE
ncbi:MAG: UMP kinase [Phycisphaerae bacterium]|nr:UMP kinase [Phycisphaerae bacterium]